VGHSGFSGVRNDNPRRPALRKVFLVKVTDGRGEVMHGGNRLNDDERATHPYRMYWWVEARQDTYRIALKQR